MKIYNDIFNQITSLKNLFIAWEIFKRDKQHKRDVQKFEWNLERELLALYQELKNGTYRHGEYSAFFIRDPKQRHIHKATVRDRVLHHAVFRILYRIYELTFIATSFSCRISKGTHRGVHYLNKIIRKISRNYTRPCFVFKCDIKKFFDSIDHDTLLGILERRVKDHKAMWLLETIVESYSKTFVAKVSAFTRERERERVKTLPRKGVPIGNLTSQLFANIYMNEFDQFVKHELKIKYYARYTDDFVIISESRKYLEALLPKVTSFLNNKLLLELHPKKVTITKYTRGADFLGYVVLPHHKILRTKTRKRIFKKLKIKVSEYKKGKVSKYSLDQSLNSYLGVLSHANAYELSQKLKNQFWFWLTE